MYDPIAAKHEFEDRAGAAIAKNIREMREKEGLTLSKVDTVSGIAWKTISNWEKGLCEPSVPKLLWLCRAMKWDLSDVLRGI